MVAFSGSDVFQGYVTAPDGSVYSNTLHNITTSAFNGQPGQSQTWSTLDLISGPVAGADQSTPTGVNPSETSYSLMGHTIPISLGRPRIGGEIISGPLIDNGNASFCISFGLPFDIYDTRTLVEIAFDSEVVWAGSLVGSGTPSSTGFTTEPINCRFYEGSLTQAADALEISRYGVDAVAYRPQMLIWFENLPLANTKFKKIPYVSAVIEDSTGGAVNFGTAFETIAYSPWVGYTSAQFETSGITDGVTNGGIIITQPAEFLATIQQFGRFYPKWDILQTDKLRIVDRGDNVTADITLNKTRLMDKVVISRAEPNSVPSILQLSTIDPDSDYTIVQSQAQSPRAPVAVSTSVKTDSAYLPAIMDADTRTSIVTFAKYNEERTRKKIGFTSMIVGLGIEPGDLVAITGLGDDFENEIFKVIETTRGANYVVEVIAESILRCGGSHFVLDDLIASAGWSCSRPLAAGYLGPLKTTSGGFITRLYDQTGNARDLVTQSAGRDPASTTAGPNSISCADFDGSNDVLTADGGIGLSHFITASTGYMIASIYIDSFPTNSASSWSNSIILGDGGSGFARMTVRSGNIYYAFNWDGNEDHADGTVNIATPYVVEWRHEGGILYERVNGTNEHSVSSGNTSNIGSGALKMGGVDGTLPFDGKIFEAITFSTVPSLAKRDALVQDLGIWIGAAV